MTVENIWREDTSRPRGPPRVVILQVSSGRSGAEHIRWVPLVDLVAPEVSGRNQRMRTLVWCMGLEKMSAGQSGRTGRIGRMLPVRTGVLSAGRKSCFC